VPSRRSAYFPECGGWTDTDVFRREDLRASARVDGPAIIEERESTTVLPPGLAGTVDGFGNLVVAIG
jgi:N-methylhydantoinase A